MRLMPVFLLRQLLFLLLGPVLRVAGTSRGGGGCFVRATKSGSSTSRERTYDTRMEERTLLALFAFVRNTWPHHRGSRAIPRVYLEWIVYRL